MKEQLVSFKTAKLAKEKGFNIPCKSKYTVMKTKKKFTTNSMLSKVSTKDNVYAMPTQSLLQKWLRDKFKIYITIGVNYNTKGNIESFNYSIEGSILNKGVFESYEESLENAFYEALNKV